MLQHLDVSVNVTTHPVLLVPEAHDESDVLLAVVLTEDPHQLNHAVETRQPLAEPYIIRRRKKRMLARAHGPASH